MMMCGCGAVLNVERVEEWEDGQSFLCYGCPQCGAQFGVHPDGADVSPFLDRIVWTDEAQHDLERLPPYVEPLVRKEVEDYAAQKSIKVIASGVLTEARNRGAVVWHPDAERRLSRVPRPVRAMARVELERTALDRGMPEVTVELMEELKARYFGMAAQKS